ARGARACQARAGVDRVRPRHAGHSRAIPTVRVPNDSRRRRGRGRRACGGGGGELPRVPGRWWTPRRPARRSDRCRHQSPARSGVWNAGGALMSKATASGALGLAFASPLGWLCCLPIASGAFGIALAALAAAVGPWWPVLAFASLVLLVVAIVQTLRGGGGPRSDHCEHAKPRPAAMALRQH